MTGIAYCAYCDKLHDTGLVCPEYAKIQRIAGAAQDISPKPNEAIIVDEEGTRVDIGNRVWRDAFHDKALSINWNLGGNTLGYRIMWVLWSADIWFGRFPLIKFIIGVNILVWILILYIGL